MGQKILRLPIVKERTGLSRSTIYLRMSHGAFPRQFSLGGGQAIGWLESDIEDWIAAQVRNKREVRGRRTVTGLQAMTRVQA